MFVNSIRNTTLELCSTHVLPAQRQEAHSLAEVVDVLQGHRSALEATLSRITSDSPVYLHVLGSHAEVSLALLLAKEALLSSSSYTYGRHLVARFRKEF